MGPGTQSVLGGGAPSMQYSPEPGASAPPSGSADNAGVRAQPPPLLMVSLDVTLCLLALLLLV